MAITVNGNNMQIPGTLDVGTLTPARSRSLEIAPETFRDLIPLSAWRVWNTDGTVLPATAANDDLALIHGTLGTEPFHISAGDVKTLTGSRYARVQWKLKDTYVSGTAVSIIVLAGMQTTVAGTSCAVDFVAYSSDSDLTMSADLVTTSSASINSLTYAEDTFAITSTGFTSATELDIRMEIAYVDAATGTAVEPTVLGVWLSQTCKGG